MALVLENQTTYNADNQAGTHSFSYTTSASANLMVVLTNRSSVTPTYNSESFTQVANTGTMYVYKLENPSSGSNTMDCGTSSAFQMAVYTFEGANTTIDATQYASGSESSGVSTNITTGVDGNYVIDQLEIYETPDPSLGVAGAGQTQVGADWDYLGYRAGSSYEGTNSSGTVTMSWNISPGFGSADYEHMLVSVAPGGTEVSVTPALATVSVIDPTIIARGLAHTVYNSQKRLILRGIDYHQATNYRVILVNQNYVFDADNHSIYEHIETDEISGSGYTTEGATLSNLQITLDDNNDLASLDADNVEWPNSTITAYGAVVMWRFGLSSSLVSYIDFGGAVSTNNETLKIEWNSNGLFALT